MIGCYNLRQCCKHFDCNLEQLGCCIHNCHNIDFGFLEQDMLEGKIRIIATTFATVIRNVSLDYFDTETAGWLDFVQMLIDVEPDFVELLAECRNTKPAKILISIEG